MWLVVCRTLESYCSTTCSIIQLHLPFRNFPCFVKNFQIMPIYKSGDKSDVSNYRPISILFPISKILEKLIRVRSVNFFTKHSVLLPTQYGFRAKHSASHALTGVLTSLYDNINEDRYAALLLLNLKKAFDTVN